MAMTDRAHPTFALSSTPAGPTPLLYLYMQHERTGRKRPCPNPISPVIPKAVHGSPRQQFDTLTVPRLSESHSTPTTIAAALHQYPADQPNTHIANERARPAPKNSSHHLDFEKPATGFLNKNSLKRDTRTSMDQYKPIITYLAQQANNQQDQMNIKHQIRTHFLS